MVLQETWLILIFFCYLWIFLCAYSLSKTGQWSNFSWSAGTLVSIWYEVSKVACLYVQLIILINLKLLIFVYLQFTGMALSNSRRLILSNSSQSYLQLNTDLCSLCETLHSVFMQTGATEMLWATESFQTHLLTALSWLYILEIKRAFMS